jgi:hypothetical protein
MDAAISGSGRVSLQGRVAIVVHVPALSAAGRAGR